MTPAVLASLGHDPENQVVLQSILDLPAHFQLDVTGRYVDELTDPQIPAMWPWIVRVAWEYKHWEISVVGQNLLDRRHPEFGVAQEIPRSVYGKVAFRW